jgi:hypothetical protein
VFQGKEKPIEVQEANSEFFFMIDALKAVVSPHYNTRKILDNELFTFFVELTSAISAGIVANYLYNLFTTKKIKEIKINGKKIEITNKDLSIKIIEGELIINEPK